MPLGRGVGGGLIWPGGGRWEAARGEARKRGEIAGLEGEGAAAALSHVKQEGGEEADWRETLWTWVFISHCEIPGMPSARHWNHWRWHGIFTAGGPHRTPSYPRQLTGATHEAETPQDSHIEPKSQSKKEEALFIDTVFRFDPTADVIREQDQTAQNASRNESDGQQWLSAKRPQFPAWF